MARRKKSSPLEDVLDLLAMLPWWVCLVLAAVSYFLLHRLAVPIQASDIQGQGGVMVGAMMQKAIIHGLANAGQYIVPLLCIAAAALSAWRRKQRQTLVSDVAQARNADALDGMSWREFELLVGEAYRLQGYRVTEIGGGGPDGGVDLVLAKGAEKFFVQCKQWKAYKVGVTTVRELYGVMAAKGATAGFVVTSGRFTSDAKDFAQGRNIELVDGPRLFAMIQQARGTQGQPAAAQRETSNSMESPAPQPQSPVQAPQATAKAAAQPECPRCGAAMALRTARQGANAGNTFWGCTTYPKCRGTVAAS
ncbi:restriction system protein [Paenacidovorax caeni]|uniref:Restriction system protein n=1 Tax=Paenacidovorax caeni TaxID=343013 RepID=A0A1I7KS11_9BURK|nr:restriction endonuclease [Paenacidovorax caeni]SFV00262.1 restriction system protein [Paenacidovorax caeni]